MNFIPFPLDDRKAASAFLKSRPNVVAGLIVEAVSRGEPVSRISDLLCEPCAAYHWKRSGNSRSNFERHSVIDACAAGMGEMGITEKHERENVVSMTLGVLEGPLTSSDSIRNRAECMALLLETGFPPGSNGWRGEFLPFIVAQWLRDPANILAEALGRVVVAHRLKLGHKVLNMTAPYEWFHTARTTQLFIALAPQSEWNSGLNTAIRYCSCSLSSGQTEEDRLAAFRLLLDAGARPDSNDLLEGVIFNNHSPTLSVARDSDIMTRLQPLNPTGLLAKENAGVFAFAQRVHNEWCTAISSQSAHSAARVDFLRPAWRALHRAIMTEDMAELRSVESTMLATA